MISSGALFGSRLAVPAASDSPQTWWNRSGTKWMVCQMSAISAVSSTFFGPMVASAIGMSLAGGRFMNLIGLPSPVPPSASGS